MHSTLATLPAAAEAALPQTDATMRLLVSCPDRPGIIATVSRFLFDAGANIVRSDQYSTDPSDGTFFLRMEFTLAPDEREAFAEDFGLTVADRFHMTWGGFWRSVQQQLGELLGGVGEVEALARSVVEFVGDGVELGFGDGAEVRCPWGSTDAAGRWCSRWSRVARGACGSQKKTSMPASTWTCFQSRISGPWAQVSERCASRAASAPCWRGQARPARACSRRAARRASHSRWSARPACRSRSGCACRSAGRPPSGPGWRGRRLRAGAGDVDHVGDAVLALAGLPARLAQRPPGPWGGSVQD
jgi:hypothetical protein